MDLVPFLVPIVLCLISWWLFSAPGKDGEGPIERVFYHLHTLVGNRPRDIRKFTEGDDRLYLRRYYLTPDWWIFRWLPVRIFLHHIVRDDDDRDPHDHPWKFWTFILWGAYRENILDRWVQALTAPDGGYAGFNRLYPNGSRDTYRLDEPSCVWPWAPVMRTRIARPGRLLKNEATHTHRVEVIRPVWTVFICWPAEREWGFWTQKKDAERTPVWVDWRTYLGIPDEPISSEDVIARPEEKTPRVKHETIGDLLGSTLGDTSTKTPVVDLLAHKRGVDPELVRARLKWTPADANADRLRTWAEVSHDVAAAAERRDR